MAKQKLHSYFTGLTEEQEKVILSDANRIGVDASAGSGKTRVLIARILRLLEEKKADLNDIVAITFTEKASAEMRQRLRDAFREYARSATAEELNQWRWREQQLESARICTIHSFCAGILRQYALKFGFDPEFRILDELQSPLFLDRFIQNQLPIWIESIPEITQLMVELSPQRFQKTVEFLFQNALHILPWVDRVKRCSDVEEYIAQCVQQFEKKYEEYLLRFVESETVLSWIKQLESLCELVSPDENGFREKCGYYLQCLKDLTNAKTIQEIFAKKSEINFSIRLSEKDEREKQLRKIREDIKGELKKLIIEPSWESPSVKNAFVVTHRVLNLFDRLYAQWVDYKRKQGVVDFDDLIHLTCDLLEQNTEVCQEIAGEIKYIFVDEFQDTDHAQVELIRLLLSANPELHFFFVGDAKQSIYAFRNAEVKVFQEQRKSIDPENLFSLDYNFRSAQEILSFVNTFFKETNLLSAVEENYRPMKFYRNAYGEPRVEFLLSTTGEEGEKTLKEDDVELEAQVIAERIYSLVNGEKPLMIMDGKSGEMRTARYGDFTLLFCSKNYIYKYEKALKDRGIPCFVVSSRGFFEITEVKDILNFLHILANPYNDIALLSFLRGPFCGLSDEQIVRWQMSSPLYNILLDWNNVPEFLHQDNAYRYIYELYQYFRQKTHLPIEELIQEIIQRTGYEGILSGQWFGEQKVANLQKFLALSRAYQEKNPVSLNSFLRFVERSRDKIMEGEADLAVEAENAVVLMTIHQAKGLEYPVVVLPLLYEKRQHKKSSVVNFHKEIGVVVRTGEKDENDKGNIAETIIKLHNTFDEYQEYLRLFYVALTRARDYLILSSNKKYLDEFYEKMKINSRLSLLADCFPLEKDTDLYRIVEIDGKKLSTADRERITKKINIPEDLIAPVSITEQYFEVEPVSVTRLLNLIFEEGYYDEEVDEIHSGLKSSFYAERGIFYHKLLQKWNYDADDRDTLKEYVLSLMFPDVSPEIIQQEKEVCTEKIIQNSAYPILKKNPPVYREFPFLWRCGQYLIQGTVDAILSDGTIVDYKTGENAPEYAERYWKQLEIYYYAMKDLGLKLNNKLILVYIDLLKYDIKDIETTRDVLEAEIHRAMEKYIGAMNQG